MHSQRWATSSELVVLRQIPSFVCLLFLLSCSTNAFGEWNLPQSTERTSLPTTGQQALESVLAGPATPVPLSRESAAPIIASLPKGFRDSCNKIVENWPGAKGTGQWTVRVLLSTRNESEIEAVVVLRCGSSHFDMKDWYDERPAVVVLTRESGSLHLVPLEKECNDCERFYHVEFSKAYTAVGTRLVELQAYYSDDNPCCDGTDHKEGTRLVVFSLPVGEQVLSMVQHTDENSVDDEAGTDTEWVCEANIDYGRDAADNVEMIRTKTHCTVDNKPEPVKEQNFQWNAQAHRFEEAKAGLR
jgi:predicted  nucleic acid-binding Zn-ribbon protein